MGFEVFERKMRERGLHDLQIEQFRRHYGRLVSGERGVMPESSLDPVPSLPGLEDLPEGDESLRDRVVILNLNGGLGTSMGLTGPKSLLRLRGELTFLDVLARQVLATRKAGGGRLPLVLMNSFNTSSETMAALEAYPSLHDQEVPVELLQSQVPKVRADDLQPVEWPANPHLEWCPPGHGDVYTSLFVAGSVERLLEEGFLYLFLSNVDNLGATLDLRLPAYMAAEQVPFLMEVAVRTHADRKGGHLARRRSDGRLVLREAAQCPSEEEDRFQDVERYRYFNTNNLWVDLRALAEMGPMDLPLIVNAKTVDPRDGGSPRVYQLETAMGAALSVFEGARAVVVPRSRFAPVKTTDDLLSVQSDAYVLTEDYQIRLHPEREEPPVVQLDPSVYKLVPELVQRTPHGPPGLLECRRLEVEGDVTFGPGVRARGEVRVRASRPVVVEETVLEGSVEL